jgi:K(+)-stimulated pyrophosphate-energized sodium pump
MFAIQVLMVLASLGSFYFNIALSKVRYGGKKEFNWEAPLTDLVWITSIVSILVCFSASKLLLGDFTITQTVDGVAREVALPDLWWVLSAIVGCGTLAGALIMEFTKIFVSTKSRHVQEITDASDHGGASLNVLSGLVAGNFSAFWMGMVILALMFISYLFSLNHDFMHLIPAKYVFGAPIFAFGLVAFGFLAMAPVTIAVDSFGPVTDNAQSVFELSRIEKLPGISAEIEKDFGFKPDFRTAKLELEKGDGAGNTFKATAKPVLIGTAVVGSTTMIFGIIMLLEHVFGDAVSRLSLVMPQIVFGLLMGGAVIYWFTGASIQAVVAGAYSAVVFIKKNIKLDKESASLEDSKRVVAICTHYAQKGLINIFIVVFAFALGLPFINPYFFIGYLIAIAFFGLFQAIFMANAGGAWDNAKKIVEVDLKMKGTPLHAATVVGDTVGDPFKDTSSVAMNPIIKFTTLFGLLAVEIAVELKQKNPDSILSYIIGAVCFLVALVFVYRSFYCMRIPVESAGKS